MQGCIWKETPDLPSLHLLERIWSLLTCTCLPPAFRACCWGAHTERRPSGPTSRHGDVGAKLWDGAEWNRPERQIQKRKYLSDWQWELAFLCYLTYKVFATSPPKSISAENPGAKDTHLEWMTHSSLRAWELADLGKREPQLCRCDTHRSGCVLLRGPTLRKACRSWKDPTGCSKSAVCWIQHMGQSWHGFQRNSVNSLEICKASWKTPCFPSGHLLWAHKIACARG